MQIKHEFFIGSYDASKNLSLKPDITEEQAWDAVLSYYRERGFTGILPSERTNHGLWIWDDSANDQGWPRYGKQYLAWVFYLEHRNHSQRYPVGGVIVVDAHTGKIINITEIV